MTGQRRKTELQQAQGRLTIAQEKVDRLRDKRDELQRRLNKSSGGTQEFRELSHALDATNRAHSEAVDEMRAANLALIRLQNAHRRAS